MREPGSLSEMKDWVGYQESDAVLLLGLLPLIEPHVQRIIDRFYDEVQRHPGSANVIDGPAQIERLKLSLRGWLREVFVGPHDQHYAERRRQIGHRHVQVGLADRYMYVACQLIEDEVLQVLHHALADPWPAMRSLRRVLTLDLALMTGTYVEGRERRQVETLQEILIEQLRVAVFLVDPTGRIRAATPATVTQISGAPVVGRLWTEALPAVLIEAGNLEQHVTRALERHREVTLPRVDAEDRSFRIHIVPLRHDLAEFLIQIEELTDAVAMEARVRRSEALAQLGTMSATVAHELRNPLAGISGALQVITRSMDGAGTEHRVLTKVLDEVRRLDTLVTDLLSFARPHAVRWVLTDLRRVADEVASLVRIDNTQLEVDVVGRGEREADPDLVRQILHNLLRNAVDAVTDAGATRIQITVDPTGLQVDDAGDGVPAHRVEQLFEPFVTTKIRGTGLGLAISVRSAEAMGATLALVPGTLGGACFDLRWNEDSAGLQND